jgi:phosphoglycolate phosphatase-like HAD superfamily hydrolase
VRTLVIFDVDGTLTDSNEVDAVCYLAALSETLGLHLDSPDWSRFQDCSDAGIAADLFQQQHGRSVRDEEMAVFQEAFLDRLQRTLATRPCAEIAGAQRLLAHLRKGSLRPDDAEPRVAVCIATGAWKRSAELKLAAAGIDVSGLALASCDDARNRCGIVRAAVARAQDLTGTEAFDACVSVGDGVWDVETAATLGLGFIGVGRGERAARLREHGARLVLEDLRDAHAFVDAVATLTGAPRAGR